MKIKILFLALFLSLFYMSVDGQKGSKKIIITGHVNDANMSPVQGAMILVDKKNTNVLTDSKGFYKIKVKPDAKLITAFTLASGTGDAEIGGRTYINLILTGVKNVPPAASPDEDKVNIGYGTARRKDINSQVNKMTTPEEKYASYSNIYDMLKGAVPGLQVVGKNITIQGQDFHNSNPLLVVDGNIVTSIDDIQPVTVKSVEVLKGASASIYGSRGSGGVILIHLKGTSERK